MLIPGVEAITPNPCDACFARWCRDSCPLANACGIPQGANHPILRLRTRTATTARVTA